MKYLFLTLIVLAVLGSNNIAFSQGFSVDENYDKFENRTTVILSPNDVAYKLKLNLSYYNSKDDDPVRNVYFTLTSESNSWTYLNRHELICLIDGERYGLPTTHDGIVGQNMVYEVISSYLPVKQLSNIANAKKVECRLNSIEFELTPEYLASLKMFEKKLKSDNLVKSNDDIESEGTVESDFDIDKLFNCLEESITFFGKGGDVFKKNGCNIYVSKPYSNGTGWIYSRYIKGKNPKYTYSIRASVTLGMLKNGRSNEYTQTIKDDFPSVKECYKAYTQGVQLINPKVNNKSLKPSLKVENSKIPDYCSKIGPNTGNYQDNNSIPVEETAIVIKSKKSKLLDYSENTLKSK